MSGTSLGLSIRLGKRMLLDAESHYCDSHENVQKRHQADIVWDTEPHDDDSEKR